MKGGEWAHCVADNKLSELAELDASMLKAIEAGVWT